METIAHYHLLERLGSGALGDVYRARDLKVGRTVALMAPPPALLAGRRDRFLADARAAAALNHPNIATLFDVVEHDDRCYLAYEFAAGPSLREELADRSVNLRRAMEIAAQMSDALAEGHSRGIVHGDLRPDNVVVTPKGSVKILNFGLSRWTTGGQARAAAGSSAGLGSDPHGVAGYLSPEEATGGAVDERSDVFSFGVILQEMVTGRNPFVGPTPAATVSNVLNLSPPPLSTSVLSVPADLDALVARMLARSANARPQNALLLSSGLRRIVAALDAREGEVAPAELIPVVQTSSSGWWIGGVALLIAALAAWWLL